MNLNLLTEEKVMSAIANKEKYTKVLEILIPEKYDVVSVLSVLITEYKLEVEILLANLDTPVWEYKWLNQTPSLENQNLACCVHFVKIKLLGNNQQLFQSLSYLTGLGIKLKIDCSQPVQTKINPVIQPHPLHCAIAA